MDSKIFWALIVIAFTLLIFIGMWRGWLARKRSVPFPAPYQMPNILGAVEESFELFYVATTQYDQPLERINSSGLGFRGRASFSHYEAGFVLDIDGEEPLFFPEESIQQAERATWTIDRVVEPDGLIKMSWTWGERELDSYFRVLDRGLSERLLTTLNFGR